MVYISETVHASPPDLLSQRPIDHLPLVRARRNDRQWRLINADESRVDPAVAARGVADTAKVSKGGILFTKHDLKRSEDSAFGLDGCVERCEIGTPPISVSGTG